MEVLDQGYDLLCSLFMGEVAESDSFHAAWGENHTSW